jgi:hypothetical protein
LQNRTEKNWLVLGGLAAGEIDFEGIFAVGASKRDFLGKLQAVDS